MGIGGLAIAVVAIVACVWAVANAAKARARSAELWSLLAVVLHLLVLGLSYALLALVAAGDAPFDPDGLLPALAALFVAPFGIAGVTLVLIRLLRHHLRHGASQRSTLELYLRNPETMESHLGKLELGQDRWTWTPKDPERPNLEVPLSSIRHAEVDGEYLRLDTTEHPTPVAFTPPDDLCPDRQGKLDLVESLERRLG